MTTRHTPLRDERGRTVATYLPLERDGKPFADLLEPAPGVAVADVVRVAFEQLRGWGAGPDLALGEALVAAGATPTRQGAVMSLDITTSGGATPDVPEGIAIAPLTARPEDLLDAVLAAFPPGHPDHRAGATPASELEDLRTVMSGERLGPLMAVSRQATTPDGAVVAAAIVCDNGAAPAPFGGPWLADLFRHPVAAPRGTGAALIGSVARALAGAGHRHVGLVVTEGNPAQRVYERTGFTVVSRSLSVNL